MLKEKFKKKMLFNKDIRLNNELIPKLYSFSTIMPQITIFVLIKNKKSDSENLISNFNLNDNKTCKVSLNTVLFIEKMNKTEINKSSLYKSAFSVSNLLVSYGQIKSNNSISNERKKALKGINLKWFRVSSNKLLRNLLIYSKKRHISILKKSKTTNISLVTFLQSKIIEKSIVNALESVFEGQYKWKTINKSEYYFIKKNNNNVVVVSNKSGYFKKNWIKLPVFSRFSFGFRPFNSAHSALHLIKNWPININWFLKFDIIKAFDIVHKNRLKNIFLKYCPDYCIWNEINKLLESEIVGLKFILNSDSDVFQKNTLSPFLFNVYMTELDNFIELLKLKYNKTTFVSGKNLSINDEYGQFAYKFRTKKKLAKTLSEFGSSDLAFASYKKTRAVFFKKHKSARNENKKLRRITYLRYVDDFILGITGSRDFALKIAIEIETFVKSDLHLDVCDVILTGRDKGAIQFLGFNIYLSSIKNKAKIKFNNKIKSIAKYKKKSIARLKKNDARISQAYFNSIKHGFLNYVQFMYEKLNLKKNKNTDLVLIKTFVNESIEELLRINFQQQSEVSRPNLALRRFSQHFKDLFSKNVSISLKVWEKNFIKSEPFCKNFVLTREISKVIKARDKFLVELKSIKIFAIGIVFETTQKEILKFYRQKQALKFFHRLPFSKFNKKEFFCAAEFLSLRAVDITRFRRISIRLNIKNFYLKLSDLGFYSIKRKSSLSVSKLILLNDYEIISFYNTLIKSYLNWFCCADNFISAKNIIWTLRTSCLKTLARKHKKNLKWALTIFTINVVTLSPNGISFKLPSVLEISKLTNEFLLENQRQQPNVQKLLKKYCLS